MKLRNIANLAIVVSAAKKVTIERVQVTSSGSLNNKGHNNTTGGILLEEGTKSSSYRTARSRISAETVSGHTRGRFEMARAE